MAYYLSSYYAGQVPIAMEGKRLKINYLDRLVKFGL
jgi:hypothetical protein